jgi:hypothetical protein
LDLLLEELRLFELLLELLAEDLDELLLLESEELCELLNSAWLSELDVKSPLEADRDLLFELPTLTLCSLFLNERWPWTRLRNWKGRLPPLSTNGRLSPPSI